MMMKRISLLLIGISPFIMTFSGFIFEGANDRSSTFITFHLLVGNTFFVIWFLVGWLSSKFIHSRIEMLLLLNATALLMLLLQLYQTLFFADELFYRSLFFDSFLGFLKARPYHFYFPFFRAINIVTHRFYGWDIHGFLHYLVPFVGLVIFSLLGRVIAEWKEKKATVASKKRDTEKDTGTEFPPSS